MKKKVETAQMFVNFNKIFKFVVKKSALGHRQSKILR